MQFIYLFMCVLVTQVQLNNIVCALTQRCWKQMEWLSSHVFEIHKLYFTVAELHNL